MSLKLPVGHIDVVKQGTGFSIRVWNGENFERIGNATNSLKKEQLVKFRDDLNTILKAI